MKVSERAEYEALSRIIREGHDEPGVTLRALARQAGRTETSIDKIEARTQRVDIVELLDIVRALGIGIVEFARRFADRIESDEGLSVLAQMEFTTQPPRVIPETASESLEANIDRWPEPLNRQGTVLG